jgi:tRNA-binding protein
MSETTPIAYGDFERVDIRVGTIVDARPFEGARKPALQLWIDFGGDLGVRKSSAQLTVHYSAESLIGRQVAAVINFPPRQIGKFMSQVLGFPAEDGSVGLVVPDKSVPNGGKLF